MRYNNKEFKKLLIDTISKENGYSEKYQAYLKAKPIINKLGKLLDTELNFSFQNLQNRIISDSVKLQVFENNDSSFSLNYHMFFKIEKTHEKKSIEIGIKEYDYRIPFIRTMILFFPKAKAFFENKPCLVIPIPKTNYELVCYLI